jgi:hypothetical protein
MKLEYYRQIFQKVVEMLSFVRPRPVETGLFHADRQTDMTKPILAFLSFDNAPKKSIMELAKLH